MEKTIAQKKSKKAVSEMEGDTGTWDWEGWIDKKAFWCHWILYHGHILLHLKKSYQSLNDQPPRKESGKKKTKGENQETVMMEWDLQMML